MTGRRVESLRAQPAGGRRWALLGLGALALVLLGVAVGSRLASPGERVVTQTVSASETSPPSGSAPPAAPDRFAQFPRTREGATAAATAYVSALSGQALLDRDRLRGIVERIASGRARTELVSAYATAASETRRRLGVDASPTASVFLRVAPVGFRVAAFTENDASVLVWRVGIVASGATVQPQQVWTTETVGLVWEDDTWKATDLRSAPGPTPPLSASASPAGDLFSAIPTYQEFRGVQP
jgi:hypothetical protein